MKNRFVTSALILSIILLSAGCSSGPKRAMEVSTVYNSAASMLESANSLILSGDYDKAAFFLSSSKKLAMSVDNYDLLTSIALANSNLQLSYNPPEVDKAREYTELAGEYAKYSSNVPKQQALVELNYVRVELSDSSKTPDFGKLHSKITENQKILKGDAYNEAQFISVHADVYRLQKNYSEAENLYVEAAKVYTDNRYLSEIGITWYKIAQVRSLNNNKQGALQAMEQAIYYDRCAENSLALAIDYKAVGTILMKGNPTEAEKTKADYAFAHSKEIYEAITSKTE